MLAGHVGLKNKVRKNKLLFSIYLKKLTLLKDCLHLQVI